MQNKCLRAVFPNNNNKTNHNAKTIHRKKGRLTLWTGNLNTNQKKDKLSRCRQVEAHLDISGARSLDCPRFSWEIVFFSWPSRKTPKMACTFFSDPLRCLPRTQSWEMDDWTSHTCLSTGNHTSPNRKWSRDLHWLSLSKCKATFFMLLASCPYRAVRRRALIDHLPGLKTGSFFCGSTTVHTVWSANFHVACLHVGSDLVDSVNRKPSATHDVASGLGLGWALSIRGVWLNAPGGSMACVTRAWRKHALLSSETL